MGINPMNVLQLLLVTFSQLQLEHTPVIQPEIELKGKIEKIFFHAMHEFNDVEVIEDETLDFQEPYKDIQMQIIKDDKRVSSLNDDMELYSMDSEELPHDYKSRTIQFWQSQQGKNLALQTVQNRFRKVKSIPQLKRWAHTLNQGGTYREKLGRICQFVLENFQNAINAEDFRFKAAIGWVRKFKHAHRIVSRKINNFVTRETLEGAESLQANAFVAEIKQEISAKGLRNIYNSDQSGFQLEMYSGRTSAIAGEQQVQCLVQSVSSATHSYTIQPLITADGKLLLTAFPRFERTNGRIWTSSSEKFVYSF